MEIKVEGFSLSPNKIVAGPCGSFGLLKLSFTFDEQWKGLKKTVVFVKNDFTKIEIAYQKPAVEINIPEEIMNAEGVNFVYVVGTNDNPKSNKRIVTLSAELIILPSHYIIN